MRSILCVRFTHFILWKGVKHLPFGDVGTIGMKLHGPRVERRSRPSSPFKFECSKLNPASPHNLAMCTHSLLQFSIMAPWIRPTLLATTMHFIAAVFRTVLRHSFEGQHFGSCDWQAYHIPACSPSHPARDVDNGPCRPECGFWFCLFRERWGLIRSAAIVSFDARFPTGLDLGQSSEHSKSLRNSGALCLPYEESRTLLPAYPLIWTQRRRCLSSDSPERSSAITSKSLLILWTSVASHSRLKSQWLDRSCMIDDAIVHTNVNMACMLIHTSGAPSLKAQVTCNSSDGWW